MDKEEVKKANKKGKMVFWVVSALVFVYFWWFLIYDHGVKPMHG